MQGLRSRPFQFIRVFFTAPRFWLSFILLIALALRLFHLNAMSLWWDESLSYDRAQHDLATIFSGTIQIQNVITHDLHPPLYFVLLHFAVRAFGTTEFALRILSTFANVLTVALLYPTVILLTRLRRIRNGAPVALLAAFLAALSPFYVWYAQEARPYALVLFWSLLAIYALLKLIRQPRGGQPRELPLLHFAFYFLALAATLTTHYLSFLLLPFHAMAVLIFGNKGKRIFILSALLLATFGVALLLLPNRAAQLTGSDYGSAQWVPFFIILRDVLNSFAVGVTANLDNVAWFDLALLALWCLGIAATVRRRDFRLAIFLLAFLFLPALALQAGSYLRPLYMNSRHLITASPAFYAGLAFGVAALARRLSHGRVWPRARYAFVGIAASALVTGGAAYALNNLYFNPAYAKDDHRAWAEFLRERVRPSDLLILNAPQAETIYRYYAPSDLEWISLPNLGLSRAEQEKRDFAAVVNAYRQHERIWYLELHRPVADSINHIYNLLDRFGTWLDQTKFSGTSTQIVLQEIVRDSPILKSTPAIQNPRDATFGNNLQLLGYDAPTQMAAGAHGAVKFYWKLTRPSGEDYGVSLRVVDEAGNRWGQWDAVPLGNLLPVSKWPASQPIVETHHLPIEPGTPPGKYHFEVSVYHAASGEPLSSNSTLRLSDITITRPASPLDPRTLTLDHHANIKFSDALAFVGYSADDIDTHPGDEIPVTLYFQLLNNPGHDIHGRVALASPWWVFWNARAYTPFTLSLAGRVLGDIVQTRVLVRDIGDEILLEPAP